VSTPNPSPSLPFPRPCRGVQQLVAWDFDALAPNDRIGTMLLDFKKIEASPMPPTWLNIYGAPEKASPGPNRKAMNKYPEQATNYRWARQRGRGAGSARGACVCFVDVYVVVVGILVCVCGGGGLGLGLGAHKCVCVWGAGGGGPRQGGVCTRSFHCPGDLVGRGQGWHPPRSPRYHHAS
jgi:hypothetical protein